MINKILHYDTAVLYWDFNENTDKYYIYSDGEYVMETSKTHFTLRNISKSQISISIYTDADKNNLFYTEVISLPPKPRFVDITATPYNAVGDGRTLNTESIQSAIDDCKTGDCLYIPKGIFLTGALRLHSDMEVYIQKEAVLKGSTNPNDYLPKIFSRFEGYEMECYSSLLNIGDIKDRDVIKERNVKIYGGGTIEGGGLDLANNVISNERENLKSFMDSLGDKIESYERFDTIPGRLRPKLLNISCTENLVLENISIKNGSCWNVHMIYSKDIVTCNCNFYSHGIWNSDGWDPDSSENCTIFNCDFNTGDDCVAIKSGKNPEGNIINKPCKNIKIFDCRCETAHGFTIGSEMSGGVDGVYIWDSDMTNSIYGIEIKATKKRGGYVKNVVMQNSKVSRVLMHAVGYNNDGDPAPNVPVFKDCIFKDLLITGESLEYGSYRSTQCDAIEMIGFDKGSEIDNIIFENISIGNNDKNRIHTISMQCLTNINFKNLKVK